MNKKRLMFLAIFLVVFAISVFLIPPTLAIFRSTSVGTGTINLAKWEVSLNQTGINNTLNLVSGVNNQTYTVKVKSTSEVDIEYKFIISGVPDGVEIALGDSDTFKAPDSNHQIEFDNVGTILYSDSTKEKSHTLKFKSNLGTEEVSNKKIDISVVANQII